jgi:hypothetical protein
LNWNNSTERTSPRWVLATNKANILLTSNRARAVLSSRDRGNKRKIPHLTIAVTAAIVALNVGGYLDVVPRSTGSISIDHTCIRSSAIRIDLVDSHLKAAARVDLRKLTASLFHDVERALLDLVVTTSERLANCVSGITAEASSIGLEGTASGTIARSGCVNTESHARAASVSNCIGDYAVGSCHIGSDEKSKDDVLDGGHCECFCGGGSSSKVGRVIKELGRIIKDLTGRK